MILASNIGLISTVIIIYTIIPVVVKVGMKNCFGNYNGHRNDSLPQQHQEMLRRIQTMSALTIFCFCFTNVTGFILSNVLQPTIGIYSYNSQSMTPFILIQTACCFLVFNAPTQFFLYVYRDELFRKEFCLFIPSKCFTVKTIAPKILAVHRTKVTKF